MGYLPYQLVQDFFQQPFLIPSHWLVYAQGFQEREISYFPEESTRMSWNKQTNKQTKPNQTERNQTKTNQTKPKQIKPNQNKPKETKPKQNKSNRTKTNQNKQDQNKPNQTKQLPGGLVSLLPVPESTFQAFGLQPQVA